MAPWEIISNMRNLKNKEAHEIYGSEFGKQLSKDFCKEFHLPSGVEKALVGLLVGCFVAGTKQVAQKEYLN